MAERVVSPAVVFNEKDSSFLPRGITEIGAAFVGPTTKGEAFIPIDVDSYSDYQVKFGSSDGYSYVPYAVKNYLKNAATAKVVRLLGLSGYNPTVAGLVVSSSAGEKLVSIMHHTTTTWDTTVTLNGTKVIGGAGFYSGSASGSAFVLQVSGASGTTPMSASNFSCSLDIDNPNYLSRVLTSAAVSSQKAYNYLYFSTEADAILSGSANASVFVVSGTLNHSGSTYSQATTPWITSQKLNGANAYNLFRFHTISHGNYTNREVKVGILNVKTASEIPASDFGTFSIVVRTYNDTDRKQLVLETFDNLTLDPDSPNYICRVIGDKYKQYNTTDEQIYTYGDYDNKSKYIYVEVDDNVKNKAYSGELIPWGFRAVYQPVSLQHNGVNVLMPSASLVIDQVYNSEYNKKVYYGFNFDFSATDNLNYLLPVMTNTTTGSNADFNLDNYTVNANAEEYAGYPFTSGSQTPISARKFIVPFQGGFDGWDPAKPKYMGSDITATNTMGLDCSTATTAGSQAYQIAFNILEDQLKYDFNAIYTPGIIRELHSSVVSNCIDMVETREDAFYVFDCSAISSNYSSAVSTVEDIDSSYAATYFPWTKILDADKNKYMWVPPSCAVPEAFSFNDRYGYEWYAPAGYNRGALSSVVDTYVPLKRSQLNDLYEGRVNPIVSFPGDGPVVWGQKTMQAEASALDRINVRRLLINIKKYIASTTKYLVFDNNTSKLRSSFLNIVNPYLESVQQKNGLYVFKVVCDETNNTSDIIDRNQLKGEIWLQPAKSAEMILVDLNLTPTGASFSQ